MRMRVLPVVLGVAALAAATSPAAAERLVASLSTHRVMITSNFTVEELVLFGGIEQDSASGPRRGGYDIVVTVTGPRQSTVTFRKQRMLAIWVNADSRVFEDAPSYLAVLSNRPLSAIASTEALRRLQLGIDNIPLPQRASVNAAVLQGYPTQCCFRRVRQVSSAAAQVWSAPLWNDFTAVFLRAPFSEYFPGRPNPV